MGSAPPDGCMAAMRIPMRRACLTTCGSGSKGHVVEGIVWHHPDGRMVKIKRKDFGFKWPD